MMSGMSTPAGWGPSHQTTKRGGMALWLRWVLGGLLAGYLGSSVGVGLALLLGAPPVLIGLAILVTDAAEKTSVTTLAELVNDAHDPLAAIQQLAGEHGNGVYLGLDERGGARFARTQRAVLLLGPPRSGKTTAVIVPALIAHNGPAVCTSTKTDVAAHTRFARKRLGQLWIFDPTGERTPAGFQQLRWSPVQAAGSWEQALLIARAMTTSVGAGTTHGSHWATRSQALLAPLLHAAALDGRDMESVVDWVMRHELDEPGVVLERPTASRLAFSSLLGILNTEERERASIFSATADALVAYNSETALQAAKNPNIDPSGFVAGKDTVYIHAPAEDQAAAAPIVCGLLSDIRRATYLAHRQPSLNAAVLFALDEAANIAPLEELPAIASEGGGQGLALLAAFQDLSQARSRWGPAADGFLTLFGTKLILTGVADQRTLEAISVALGEYDRQIVARTTSPSRDSFLLPNISRTVTTQRTRILSPGEIAQLPAGRALHLDGLAWELTVLTPAYNSEPWKTLTTAPSAAT
jgi:type IV secretion system protein VirD4